MLVTFVDHGQNRKFGYDGVKSIDVNESKTVSIKGYDCVLERGYVARISAHEYSYFIVNNMEDNNE